MFCFLEGREQVIESEENLGNETERRAPEEPQKRKQQAAQGSFLRTLLRRQPNSEKDYTFSSG